MRSLGESLHGGQHPEQECLEQHCAQIAQRVSVNMDLCAEARVRPRQQTSGAAEVESDEGSADEDLDAGLRLRI